MIGKHGLSRENGTHTRMYRIWVGIKTRCCNQKDKAFPKYGGRGITICEEWKTNFKIFHDWAMANGYSDELTIDRIDVNGNYEPANCRWITIREQSFNRTNSRFITFKGVTKTLAEFAKEYGMSVACLHRRITAGWSVEDALTKEVTHKFLPKNK